MASWVALNIEPDEAVEDEVDDTKELQIEEALKLYQNALKLHSQGPEFYPQAAEAYEALLNSEIFKYPESLSDFKRAAQPYPQVSTVADEAVTDAIAEFNVNDSTSSLFQTLYLSYKNYGKYLLDFLEDALQSAPRTTEGAQEAERKINSVSKDALQSFAEALERDDTDLNLWRQSARLGSALQSYRLNRFCLESVLADDENRLEIRPEQLGLEEIFSEERLRNTLETLFDGLSASQVPVKKPKKALVKYLKQHADPYPYLPALPANLLSQKPTKNALAISTSRRDVIPSDATWEAVGKAILQALDEEDSASLAAAPTQFIRVILPAKDHEAVESTEMAEAETTNGTGNLEPTVKDEDIDMQGNGESAELGKSAAESAGDPSVVHEGQSFIDESAEKQLIDALEGQSAPAEIRPGENKANGEEAEPKSPTSARKRSSVSAANEDQPDGGRMKSRRTRARESNADGLVQPDEIAFDQDKYFEDRLEIFYNADEWMFKTIGSLYSKLGVEALGSIESLREKATALVEETVAPHDSETRLIQDLRGIMKTWNDEKARLMQQKDESSPLNDIRGSSKSGLAVFLEHSRKATRKPIMQDELPADEQIYAFADSVNDGWLYPSETAYEWLSRLLMPIIGEQLSEWPVMKSAYEAYLWPPGLKETVVDLLLREDEFLFARLGEFVEDLENRILETNSGSAFAYQKNDFNALEMIQSIYELHLDIFASVENLSSETGQGKRLAQCDRLARWALLARSALDLFIDKCPSTECRQNMVLRHLWASTFQLNLAGQADREHILLCLHDLKSILQSVNDLSVGLANNSIMCELSIATIDQEVLKLKCMDFFAKVLNPEPGDSVSLIEAIEPILEPSSIDVAEETGERYDLSNPTSHVSEMASFLDQGDATLRLFLWQRLLDAYRAIDYPPKVVSCYLRSIETIMHELENVKHIVEGSAQRQTALLRWLKKLDGIMGKAISLILGESEKAYECVDMDHLQTSLSAVTRLIRVLHSFIMHEDSVRVGQTSGRDLRGSLAKSLENFKERMRELYVRCWILQYTLFVEAISQNKQLFDEPLEDRIHFLRCVHNALGIRSMCRYSQKKLLKIMKSELSCLETNGDYGFDFCQVLFDLHGIKFSPFDGTTDHGCPPEKLDRSTAIMMIDFVMRQAQKMNMKDLSKSELKTTVEKMQHAIGPAKLLAQSPQMGFNRRVFTAYIKNPINPLHLLRAVQGVSELTMMTVPGENAEIAAKGWYFLLGHAALTKFRSQKRLAPGSTSELDDAVNFFRQDLDHGTGRWETWYRLAQAYDAKLEEDITWSADKINNNRNDLAATQRHAIHCYAMAVSTAIRTAEPNPETRAVLSDLYTDFGIRMYSSSREPLSMGAFSLADFSRHFSSEESQQMYKSQPFKEMSVYSVWHFASNLLKRAVVDTTLVDKSKRWIAHYFLAKCLWKMLSCDESMRTTSRRVEPQDVLEALFDAIANLPQRRDSRSEPIFEPHFKLVSVVHKLVLRGKMKPTEASKKLLASPWTRKVDGPDSIDGWKPYILEVVKKFKTADKSNWHHRMSAKAAHIIYDDQKNAAAAAAAKHELSQIFTKTLTVQVWRPEHERPGRHFVYTTRYVYFFVGLLDELDDRSSMDQLLRRVRKKQGDFINHTKLWEDMCLTYAKMIRRAAHISEGHEESVFRPIGWEEFSTKTARLEAVNQLAPESQSLLELIRDSLELKKLNNSLMKVTMFEDLVADLYARVYEANMPLLIEQANEENKEKMKVDHLLMTGDATTESSTPAASVPTSDAPAPRGRTKGIARRDIQKRADTIVNLKLGPRAAANKLTAATESEHPSSARRDSNAAGPTSAPQGPGKHEAAVDGASMEQGEADGARDSGDESTLSDVHEPREKKSGQRKLLFPRVNQGQSGGGETEGEDAGSGDEGPGEGDEDEEGDCNERDDDENGDADATATEVETVNEEGQEGDEAGDEEMLDGDEDNEDDNEVPDNMTEEGEELDDAAEDPDVEKDSGTPAEGEDAEKTEPMDVAPT